MHTYGQLRVIAFLSSPRSPTECLLLLNFDFLGNKRGDNQQILSDKQPQKMVDKMHSMVLLQNQYALSSLGHCLLSQHTDSYLLFACELLLCSEVSAHHCIWILFWAPCRTKSTMIARLITWLNEFPNTLFQLGIE